MSFSVTIVAVASTYRLEDGVNYNSSPYVNPLTNAYYWVSDDSGARAGDAGEALPSGHDYVMAFDKAKFVRATLDSAALFDEWRFPGESMSLGDASRGGTVWFLHYPRLYNKFANRYAWGNLILDSGAYIFNSARLASYSVDADISVMSADSKPFQMACSYSNCRVDLTGAISSEADCQLVIGGESAAYKQTDSHEIPTNNTWAIASSLSQYHGTLVFSNVYNIVATREVAAIRAIFSSQTMPGTLVVPDRMSIGLNAETDAFCVGRFSGGNGIFFDMPVSSQSFASIRATESFSLAGPATVYLRGTFDIDTPGRHEYTLLTVPKASAEALELVSVSVDGVDNARDAYRTEVMCVTNELDETVSLAYVIEGFPADAIYLTTSDSGSKDNKDANLAQMSTAMTNANSWSDLRIPHENATYFLRKYNGKSVSLRGHQTEDMDFPGDGLVVCNGCSLLPTRQSTFKKLCLLDGSAINVPNVLRFGIYGPIETPSGTVTFRRHAGRAVNIMGDITGGATLDFIGWNATSSPSGIYALKGLNTNFTGRIRVGENTSITPDYATAYQTLEIERWENIGGKLPAFVPAALELSRCGILKATSSMTWPMEINRGIYIGDRGRIATKDAKTVLTLDTMVTVAGEWSISGEGTVALRRAVSIAEDAVAPTLDLTAGTLRIENADAVNGLTLNVSNGVSIVFACDLSDSERTRWGIRNLSEKPFSLGEGLSKLPVKLDFSLSKADERGSHAFGLVTVKDSAADAVEAILPTADELTPHRFFGAIERRSNAEDGTVTFVLRMALNGTKVIIR